MRKIIIFKKKKIKVFKKKSRVAKLLCTAAVLGVLVGGVPAVPVQAQPQEEVTYIYHQHIGNSEEKGGCYNQPVYHVHKGNEQDGGACYQTPVYHVHDGNEAEGGSCYQTPVLHTHKGDETGGGECYQPVYHTHTEACYQTCNCHVYIDMINDNDNYDQYCAHHDWTNHVKAIVRLRHRDCGSGKQETMLEYCRKCGFDDEYDHSYQKCICSLGDQHVIGYQLVCAKTPETIDSYTLSCTKQADTIDAYAFSCMKDENTIEHYEKDCGLDETKPCGKIIVTNQTAGTSKEVELHVEVEDLTGGKLDLEENPFSWKDDAGNPLGNEDTIQIKENGSYTVSVHVKNEDINQEHLQASIHVNNVGDISSGNHGGSEDDDSDLNQGSGSGEESTSPSVTPSPTITPTIVPTAIPAGSKASSKKSSSGEITNTSDTKSSSKNQKKKAEATPTGTPVIQIKKETEKVEMPESKAINQKDYEPVRIEKDKKASFVRRVKVISITAGGLITIGGILLFILLKLKCVRIYNDDGKGRMNYIGTCIVKETQEGYVATLSDALTERACTNRYSIHPGMFSLGKKKDQELIICRQDKRISLKLSKEMIFLL